MAEDSSVRLRLLTASIGVGLLAGMSPETVIESMTSGMGNTLGFVAVVVGLGSIFGMMLEQSGGAEKLADRLVTFWSTTSSSCLRDRWVPCLHSRVS